MKIGHKIRQLRELNGLSQENLSELLKMSVAGYSRIERNEVDVNIEKLQEIADALRVKPEEILTFDGRSVFNNYGYDQPKFYTSCSFSENERKLYEDKIRLLEDKIGFLETEIGRLKER